MWSRSGSDRVPATPFGPSTLTAGAGAVFAILAAGAALRYGLQVFLARWAGPTDFGLYALAWTWAYALALLAGLGLPTAVVRLVPEYLEASDWPRLKGVLRRGRLLVVAAGVVIALPGSFLLGIWPAGGREARVIALALWLIPIIAVVEVQTEALRGLGRMVRAYAPPHLLRPGLTLIAAGVFATRGDLPAETIVVLIGGALLLTAGYQARGLTRTLPDALRDAPAVTPTREWLRLAVPLLFVSAFQMLLAQSDILIVGMWRPAEDVGVYVAAARTASLVGFVLTAVNAGVAPLIASWHARGARARVERLARGATRLMFWPSLALAVGLGLLASPVLTLFGPEFVRGATVLRILVVGHVLSAGAGPVAYLLMMTGHERACARAYGWSTAVHVLLNTLLVAFFGLMGAAVATAVGMVVWNVWLSLLVRRRLGIHPAIGSRPLTAA